MNTVIRLLLTTVVISIGFNADIGEGEGDARVAQPMVIGASAEQQQTLDDALLLFQEAGLELPPLVIKFVGTAEPCEGHAGLYRPAPADEAASIDKITICHRLPLFLVHELAHAWAHHSLTPETRQRFLNHSGLDRWNDHRDVWNNRGTERAAHTIAYALTLATPTDNPDILRLVCGYELLTGDPMPRPNLATCPEAENGT